LLIYSVFGSGAAGLLPGRREAKSCEFRSGALFSLVSGRAAGHQRPKTRLPIKSEATGGEVQSISFSGRKFYLRRVPAGFFS
jgi:hypothetical protein